MRGLPKQTCGRRTQRGEEVRNRRDEGEEEERIGEETRGAADSKRGLNTQEGWEKTMAPESSIPLLLR